MGNTALMRVADVLLAGLILVYSQAFGDENDDISDQFGIDEVFVATAYLDGGSYVITASTTDNRTIYIFINKSVQSNKPDETELAFINAENLASSPSTMRAVLHAMDARFRSHFSGKPPSELLEYIVDDAALETDRNIFGLVFLLEEVCAKQVFKNIQHEVTGSINCEFYLQATK